jgi:hypothetical protein
MDVIKKIGSIAIDGRDRPVKDVVITSVKIEKR